MFFEESNKMDRPQAILIKKKKRENTVTNIRNERWDTAMDSVIIKKQIKDLI